MPLNPLQDSEDYARKLSQLGYKPKDADDIRFGLANFTVPTRYINDVLADLAVANALKIE